jgi:hypothetical protein
MNVEDVLPFELNETLNSSEFDDEGGLVIESINHRDDIIAITLSIRFDAVKNTPNHLWLITACGVEIMRTLINWTQEIKLYNKHTLLLEFIDIEAELYFNGTTDNPQGLFVDISLELGNLAGNNIDVVNYIIPFTEVRKLSQQQYGLFAKGPKTILEVYASCLTKNGIKPIFIGEYEPTEASKSLKLLRLGESYCIGHTFKFERLS